MDPLALARVNLSVTNLAALIGTSDTKIGAGELETRGNSLVVEVKGDLDSIERIKSIAVRKQANGNFLRLGEVAEVTKAYMDPPPTLALIDGQRAIVVATTMETGRRVYRWSAMAKEVAADYQHELPDMIKLRVVIDQNHYAEARLQSLLLNQLLAIGLVLFALLFLMGVRSAIIVGAAVPFTMCIVLAGLQLLDIPLHQMSVTGLIIALGLLIDNAIVVVEEYKQNRRLGADFGPAIATSVRHLFVPLLASTATTAFAFMPIAHPGWSR